jgi:hypothetical protein
VLYFELLKLPSKEYIGYVSSHNVCLSRSLARSVRIYLDEPENSLKQGEILYLQTGSFVMEHEIQQLVDMVLSPSSHHRRS